MDKHLTPLNVAEFIEGFLDEGRAADAIEHLADCAGCAGFLADVLRAASVDSTWLATAQRGVVECNCPRPQRLRHRAEGHVRYTDR